MTSEGTADKETPTIFLIVEACIPHEPSLAGQGSCRLSGVRHPSGEDTSKAAPYAEPIQWPRQKVELLFVLHLKPVDPGVVD